ncbi:MAG TPA: dTDP-4-dehydrorhamnose reductase [Deltaproteobacteria bacterium]|nr:dTDP-4-dehydrorhamnose reductase [Deltaproteobacteria bacterium]
MKIVVAGADGLLGHEVVRVCAGYGDEVIETDVAKDFRCLDITDMDATLAFLEAEKPHWLVNCAAYTDVDGCEDREDLAYELNAKGPGYLAQACSKSGTMLLHISSDYVFDGEKPEPYTEEDPTNPLSVYGKSKLAGEEAIRQCIKDFIIVRPQWLFGPNGKNFVSTVLGIARERASINVVNDQRGSPTYSKDLARAIRALIEQDARGIFHVCNRGSASWYDLAKKALELAELETRVVPVSTSEFVRPAVRPKNSILSTKRFTETTQKLMPLWQISLQLYIKEYLFEYRKSGQA